MTLGNDNGTDGQTDGQTDRQCATHYAAPPREEGRIINRLPLPLLILSPVGMPIIVFLCCQSWLT